MSRAAQSVVVVLILAAVGVGAWWAFGRDAAAAPPAQASPDVEAKVDEVASPPTTEASPARVAREALEAPPAAQPVEGAPEATEPFDDSAAKVDPWMLRFEVVDAARQPVANAKVTIWEGRRVDSGRLRSMRIEGNSYSGHHPEPLFELVTDALGYTQVKVDIECLLASAEKRGVGNTGVRWLWSSRAAKEPVRMELERRIELRGVVLRADGTPAVGAKVLAYVRGLGRSAHRERPAELEAQVADADGRFVFSPMAKGAHYGVVAQVDEQRSFEEEVWIRDATRDVTLRFPGAITIGGVVVDERGEPVPGAVVRSWRVVDVDADGRPTEASETEQREADADGRFRIPVRRLARYQLVASHDGLAQSAPLWFEPNEARPHVEARLVLRRFATITGRVVRAGGAGFEGVHVVATAESGSRHSSVVGPGREELYGRPAAAETGADGRFEFAVHPDTTWRLSARLAPDNYRLSVELPGVQPGRTDALIRVSDAQLAGCVVRGVITVEGEEPLSGYKVEIVNYEDGESASSSEAGGEFGEREFTLQPLPLGRMFALRVSQKVGEGHFATNKGPYAPAVYGPFTPDRAEMSIEVTLKRWGELPVRVLRADGAPAVGVSVFAPPRVYMGFYPSARPVGDDGAIVLQRLVPGEADLRVFDDGSMAHEQRVRIEPGRNAEIVVRLTAASSAVDSGR